MEIFLICIAVLLLLLVAAMLLTNRIMKQRFYRGSYPKGPTAERFYEAYAMRYPRSPVSFHSGKNRLQGYIYGEGNARGLIVFAHGIGVGHETYIKELLWMVDRGWCVLAYDATGSCESEGEGTGGLVQSALDLHAALSFAESDARLSHLPMFLMGHSWGGYAVAAALCFGHDVKASASIAGYSDPLRMIAEFARMHMGRAVRLLLPFVWLWLRMRHGTLGGLTAVKGIEKSGVPVLIIHGSTDEVVTLDSVSIIREAPHLKNPNVKTLLVTDVGQTGHGSIFRHAESVSYIESVDASLKELKESYKGQVPEDVLQRFFEGVDKDIYNRPNDRLLGEIDTFFSARLS